MKKVAILLLGVHPCNANRGSAALLMSAINSLLSAFPEAHIELGSYYFEHDTFDKESSFFWRKYVNNVAVNDVEPKGRIKNAVQCLSLFAACFLAAVCRVLSLLGLDCRFVLRKNRLLKKHLDADVVADLKWGDHFTDVYGLKWTLVWVHELLIPIFLQKPFLLLPQSIGPFHTGFSRLLAGMILRRAKLVIVREEASEKFALSAGGPGTRVLRCPDLAYRLDTSEVCRDELTPLQHRSPVSDPRVLGVTLRDLRYIGFSSERQEAIIDTIAAAVRHLCELYGCDVWLIPHDGPAKSAVVYESFLRRHAIQALWIKDRAYSTEEIRIIMGECWVHVGLFMHANIAAFAAGVPSIGFAYNPKVKSIFEDIGQGEFVLDLETATAEELSEKISSAWENREAIANKLQASVAAKQSALAGLDEILRALISVREVG